MFTDLLNDPAIDTLDLIDEQLSLLMLESALFGLCLLSLSLGEFLLLFLVLGIAPDDEILTK
jgi:hypothetical protein